MPPAIRVENLSKRYRLSHEGAGDSYGKYRTLRDSLANLAAKPFKKIKSLRTQDSALRTSSEDFYALKDVSFDVQPGEVVGIIGRNGAGKSTLLKILSRITKPSSGKVTLNGRVGSLLEVGTGFHPELTGRENIFLNGSILGMQRKEIQKQFDAIVDFSGVEKFLDTPVKRYSSGMYVRLAFGVAAFLNTEVLIVDEVLAVGDMEFQRKCLGKMGDVARSGRTVIIVSHNMAAVTNLCHRATVLDGGMLAFDGSPEKAVPIYIARNASQNANAQIDFIRARPKWATPHITSARILDSTLAPQRHFALGSDIIFELTFEAASGRSVGSPVMGVVVNHQALGTVGGVSTRMTGYSLPTAQYSSGTLRCRLKEPPILQGSYTVDIWFGDGPAEIDSLMNCLSFEMDETDIYHTGRPPFRTMGTIYFNADWTFEEAKP